MKDRVVLAVHGQEGRATLASRAREERPRHHECFFVRQQDALPSPRRRQGGRKARRTHDRRHHDVDAAVGRYLLERTRTEQ